MQTGVTKRGFSLLELLIVVAIILIISAIAIPNILRARMSANESAAAGNVKLIRDSEATYMLMFGSNFGFANTLAKLGPGAPCSPTGACLLDGRLGCAAEPCAKSGYMYFMASSGLVPPSDFAVTATPVAWARSGEKNFCVTQDGVLRQEVAPAGTITSALLPNICGNSALFTAVH